MRVDAQGEARVGVSQVLRQGPDRLPRVEQDACGGMSERVHAVFAGRFDPRQTLAYMTPSEKRAQVVALTA